MKNLNYLMSILFACMLSVGLTSCGSDDNGGGGTPEPPSPLDLVDIVGTWQCVSSVDTYQGRTEMGLMVGKQITMNENGTFSSTYPGLGSSGTFTLSGNTISGQSGLGSFTIVANIADNVMRWTGTAVDGSTFEYSLTRVSNDSEE